MAWEGKKPTKKPTTEFKTPLERLGKCFFKLTTWLHYSPEKKKTLQVLLGQKCSSPPTVFTRWFGFVRNAPRQPRWRTWKTKESTNLDIQSYWFFLNARVVSMAVLEEIWINPRTMTENLTSSRHVVPSMHCDTIDGSESSSCTTKRIYKDL